MSLKPSFEEVASQELPVLYRVARRLTLDASDAEDLVGSALLLAARGWAAFDGRHPRSWLLRILKNEHLNVLRKRAVRPQTVPIDDLDTPDEGIWNDVSHRHDLDTVLAHLDRLPEEYRFAVSLCDIEEMSYEEAAEVMEVPIGTVRSRLFRGRKLLRDRVRHLVEDCSLTPSPEEDR